MTQKLSRPPIVRPFGTTARPRSRLAAAVAGAMLLCVAAGAARASAGPEEVVRTYQAGLVEVMREAEKLGFEGRVEAFDPVVREAFDLPFIARRAAGGSWSDFSEEQRKGYVDAFSRLSIATHAARFSGYSGEKFEVKQVDDAQRGYKLVRTELVTGNGETVVLNYLMGERGGRWRIVDVFARGTISEVATRRAEFENILRFHDADRLIEEIEKRIAEQRKS